ncbi:MAG TPA: C39 family peptidase [Candidatus Cloacimonadota bacterium]|nr:C39 family peptidase [Candidatus Cloacimonadota bacterium]HOF59687.1 C39 family peptidase [Candidatus Cloacimonadota bacterium]HOR58962.1 C39 family peptidase [Candidatus Cloacimonadota bacterium]HPB09342.1 C39 family peptidase [Candidatus Cloacimonadota bacterium]HPL23190.1 C39 family peptidase [Candidatus Cloacimonadota bacterium]
MKKVITTYILLIALSMLTATAGFTWYSQSDSRWENKRLGNSRSSIGKSGCVLSCLSMLLSAEASNPRVTPDNLNEWLRQNDGYVGNLMRWQVAGEIDGSGLGLELQSQTSKNNDWDYLSGELDKGNKVIVKVKGRSSHWVLVVKRDGPANKASSYIINDPGTDSFQKRTLAYFGGFKAARSYSGNWLDEEAFNLNSQINVVPVNTDEEFLYELSDLPIPADVFVTLENKLQVGISGYFMLGLFDNDNKLVRTIDYEYASLGPEEKIDLIYEMADISPLNTEGQDLRIIYSKYFTAFPSLNETLALPSPGLLNYTNTTQNQ